MIVSAFSNSATSEPFELEQNGIDIFFKLYPINLNTEFNFGDSQFNGLEVKALSKVPRSR